jgi:hypothetical protein
MARLWLAISAMISGALLLLVAPAAASVSPAKLVSSSLAAARAQRSVHYVAVDTGPKTSAATDWQVTFVGDAATDRGIQRITYEKGGRTGHVTVEVVANTAYIRGDAFTLQNYMGFPATAARFNAGKWLRLPHTASGFPTVSAGVRLASAISELETTGPYANAGRSIRHGHRVVGVRSVESAGGQTGTVTLYIRSTGTPLPVEQRLTQGKTIRGDATYSNWNEPVNLAKPAYVITLS